MWSRWLFFVLLLVALGCSRQPFKVAPVSGTVTLDSKPLPKAWVNFAPMGTKENPNPGPTSNGFTDAEGKYKLVLDPKRPGAVVGKSRVYIGTSQGATQGAQGGEDRDAGGPRPPKDKVPPKYNSESTLTFDVPPGGTDQANFDLKTH